MSSTFLKFIKKWIQQNPEKAVKLAKSTAIKTGKVGLATLGAYYIANAIYETFYHVEQPMNDDEVLKMVQDKYYLFTETEETRSEREDSVLKNQLNQIIKNQERIILQRMELVEKVELMLEKLEKLKPE